MVEVAQLHGLRVVVGIFRPIRVSVYGFEGGGAGLGFLLQISKESKTILGAHLRTYLEGVCFHRRPEVLGVSTDRQLVDLEVVWATDDGTVGVFFACEMFLAQVSIRADQEDDQGTYFARPSFHASIGVAMLESLALLLVVGCWVLDTESW